MRHKSLCTSFNSLHRSQSLRPSPQWRTRAKELQNPKTEARLSHFQKTPSLPPQMLRKNERVTRVHQNRRLMVSLANWKFTKVAQSR